MTLLKIYVGLQESLTSSIEILGIPQSWGRQGGQVLLHLLCPLLPGGQVQPQFPDTQLPGPALLCHAANRLHPPALPLLNSAGSLQHLRPSPPAPEPRGAPGHPVGPSTDYSFCSYAWLEWL